MTFFCSSLDVTLPIFVFHENDMLQSSGYLSYRMFHNLNLSDCFLIIKSRLNFLGKIIPCRRCCISFPLCSSHNEESACNAGGLSSVSGWRRSHREGHGNSLQDSCLENSMDRGAWWATGYGTAESGANERLTLSLPLQKEATYRSH